MAGLWTHRDIVQDVFMLTDLFDIHEYLDVKEENERRFQAWKDQKEKP